MKLKCIYTILTLGLISTAGCDTFYDIQILNNLNKGIAVRSRYDTIHLPESNYIDAYMNSLIPPGGTKTISFRGPTRITKEDSIYLYVYEYDTLMKYSNSVYIDTNHLYSLRLRLSYQDLEAENWKIKIDTLILNKFKPNKKRGSIELL